jgi:hypothetical protein
LVTLCQEAFEANPMGDLAAKLYREGMRWNSFIDLCNKDKDMKKLSEVCTCRLTNYLSDLEKGISIPKGNDSLR